MCDDVNKQIRSDERLAVYQAATQHYYASTNYTWQVGGPLIAGVFVLWGLMFGDTKLCFDQFRQMRLVFCCIIPIVSSIWLFFALMQRQQVYFANKKLSELEVDFKFYDILWTGNNLNNDNALKRPIDGKTLELTIFIILSLGGALGYWIVDSWSWWLLEPIIITVITTLIIIVKNIQLNQYKKNKKQTQFLVLLICCILLIPIFIFCFIWFNLLLFPISFLVSVVLIINIFQI